MAGGRKEARQWALQMLFQLDINPEETDVLFEGFLQIKICKSRPRFAENGARRFEKP